MTLVKVRKRWAKANTDAWDTGKDLVIVFDGELKKMEAGI